ncbi:MAG: serine hydrolase domain-containing protein [Acidimicrobiales bacterium]
MTHIEGLTEPGFEKVREAFQDNFEHHGDLGGAVCVHVDGTKVVDLVGGTAEPATGARYARDTLQLVFSTTKAATAICAHLLAQRGQLDFDAPVAEYWPEFAAEGKADIPVRWLMCHKAGLASIDAELTLDQALAWDPVVDALAAQVPLWEPGQAHGYHALTYGWLVGEVVRRITGTSLGQFFAQEVAEPLGLEFWIGLPESEEYRVAPLVSWSLPDDPGLVELAQAIMGPTTLLGRALTLNGAFDTLGDESPFNLRAVHAAEIPAANGITNAASLSRMYAGIIGDLDGVRILTPDSIEAARANQSQGDDKVLMMASRFGLGFMLNSEFTPLLSPGSFGHSGAGGSLGFADPETGVAFGYVMNQMQANLSADPRTLGLISAVRDSLG